jgi:hypothetical protein
VADFGLGVNHAAHFLSSRLQNLCCLEFRFGGNCSSVTPASHFSAPLTAGLLIEDANFFKKKSLI